MSSNEPRTISSRGRDRDPLQHQHTIGHATEICWSLRFQTEPRHTPVRLMKTLTAGIVGHTHRSLDVTQHIDESLGLSRTLKRDPTPKSSPPG